MKILPNNIEAEEYLVGSCFAGGRDAMSAAINAGVSPASFFSPEAATVFDVMASLVGANQKPTASLVLHELNTSRRIDAAGGMENVLRFARLVPTVAQLDFFISRVRSLQLLRSVARVAAAIHEEAYSQADNVEDFVARAERSILSATQDSVKPARSWSQAVDEAATELEAMLALKPGQTVPGEVSWGFSDFDRAFGPMQPGQLCVLAARPSVGKSSLMRQVVHALLRNGRPVYVASLEVKDRQIARNIAQALSGVGYRDLRRGAHPKDAQDFRVALQSIKALPLIAYDNFGAKVSEICAQARLLKARKNIGLVCIDHLHELGECRKPGRGLNVSDAIGVAVKEFKELAGELEVPVLLLAQLNRGSEKDSREPTLMDLKASGDIEEKADKVIFLHRPAVNELTQMPQSETSDPNDCPKYYIKALQAKGRDDGTNQVGLIFERRIAKFIQIA